MRFKIALDWTRVAFIWLSIICIIYTWLLDSCSIEKIAYYFIINIMRWSWHSFMMTHFVRWKMGLKQSCRILQTSADGALDNKSECAYKGKHRTITSLHIGVNQVIPWVLLIFLDFIGNFIMSLWKQKQRSRSFFEVLMN